MLKKVDELQAAAKALHETADAISLEANEAVKSLRACREFVTKTVAALTEDHEATVQALQEHHKASTEQFAVMLTRIDETISKLEGAANG